MAAFSVRQMYRELLAVDDEQGGRLGVRLEVKIIERQLAISALLMKSVMMPDHIFYYKVR